VAPRQQRCEGDHHPQVGAHWMMYLLIRAGMKQSKKPLPAHIRRRQPLQLRTLPAARPDREMEARIWPSQGGAR